MVTRRLLPLIAAAVLAAGAAPAARADGGHAGHEPSAAGHGMTAEEHARMSEDATAAASPAHDHAAPAATAAHDHSAAGHGEAAAPADRPAGLVLGGFALVNALVIAYAAVIRRRPDNVKRRRTLERVRVAASKPTSRPL